MKECDMGGAISTHRDMIGPYKIRKYSRDDTTMET